VVALPIEVACIGQIKPGLVVLGDRLVQQRTLRVARVVEFGLGCCLHEYCANTQPFATSGWVSLGMATIIASGVAAAALRRRALPDAPHDEQQFTPPKYAVSQVVGYIKGKSAIHLARVYGKRRRNFVGESFWARGYFVSTVGRDEEVIRNYIRHQEEEDEKLEQLGLWK
jgi:hypothetical protein